jgi:hypothetical protein
MFYLVLFCKLLITNECRIVFGRQCSTVDLLGLKARNNLVTNYVICRGSMGDSAVRGVTIA